MLITTTIVIIIIISGEIVHSNCEVVGVVELMACILCKWRRLLTCMKEK